MLQSLQKPILYLITEGQTAPATDTDSEKFLAVLTQVRAAVAASIPLVQLREKNLSTRTLYELTTRAVALTRGTETRLLVNDRADVAQAAGADGVHLTTQSLPASVVRRHTRPEFLIGVSTHSVAEAERARAGGADFAVFGPVFETPSKSVYGAPVGLEQLGAAATLLAPFPVLALGGVTLENAAQALRAGASGIAAISLFKHPGALQKVARELRAHL